MKKMQFLVCLIILLLLTVFANAQQKDSVRNTKKSSIQNSKKLPQEIQKVKSIYESFITLKDYENFEKNTSLAQLKHFAKMIYEADETDAVENQKMLDKEVDQSDSIAVLNRKFHSNLPNFERAGVTLGMISRKIYDEFPHVIFALITTPYFLKAKIISISSSKIKVNQKQPFFVSKIDLKAVVEDIIKGKSRFSVGDTLIFYYLPQWRSLTLNYFKIGSTYFLPLDVKPGEPYGSYNWLGLVTLDSKLIIPTNRPNLSQGCFPIENGYLIDENNYFGYGSKVPWNLFRSKIINQINIIKSW